MYEKCTKQQFSILILCVLCIVQKTTYATKLFMQLTVYKTDEQNLLEHVWHFVGAIIKESFMVVKIVLSEWFIVYRTVTHLYIC